MMLETRASALDKCIADAETLARSEQDCFRLLSAEEQTDNATHCQMNGDLSKVPYDS